MMIEDDSGSWMRANDKIMKHCSAVSGYEEVTNTEIGGAIRIICRHLDDCHFTGIAYKTSSKSLSAWDRIKYLYL